MGEAERVGGAGESSSGKRWGRLGEGGKEEKQTLVLVKLLLDEWMAFGWPQ